MNWKKVHEYFKTASLAEAALILQQCTEIVASRHVGTTAAASKAKGRPKGSKNKGAKSEDPSTPATDAVSAEATAA